MYIKNNELYTKINRKETDTKQFLEIHSEHRKSIKNIIFYSYALRVKRICSTAKDFEHHTQELTKRFVKQG